MTGIEVVQFSAVLSGMPQTEGLRRAHEILDFCGMKQERYRTIETFSTGMRQKIKFASAIVHDPRFLVLDEPTSGLDPEEREHLLNRIKLLAREHGKSVLISTHILPDVQAVCDHAVILAAGRVRLNESLERLNQPTSPTLTVRASGDIAHFVRFMRGLSLMVDENDDRSLRISGTGRELTEQVWTAACHSHVTILSMKPARNDLEKIFMQAVNESATADPTLGVEEKGLQLASS
jgi:ABC-2 type transport system ATP-binding protein